VADNAQQLLEKVADNAQQLLEKTHFLLFRLVEIDSALLRPFVLTP
jgi:hypothetical protein